MKRPASPRTRPDVAARGAALLFAAVLATLLLLYAPLAPPASAQESTQESTQKMPAGMEVGEDGVSIGDELFAGDGCAKAGDLVAGDCGQDKASGEAGDAGGGPDDPADEAGDGASDEQYGAEDGSGADEATVLESTTSGGSGPEGGESTQSQIIESTTGVVEEGAGADAEAAPAGAGGEDEPEGTTGEGTTGEGTTGEGTTGEAASEEVASEEVASEEVASEGGATGADAADRTCAVDGPMGVTTTTTINEATDGDTVETPEGTVRLIGVDTPETVDPDEPVEPGGEEASEFTASELEGEEVELEFGEEPKDDYGRALAYLWVEDESGEPAMFNETLLREGLGELLIIPPNDEYERCLAAAEKLAQAEGSGMWSEGGPEDGADEETVPPETTGAATATEDADADATPPADDEGGRQGLLGGLFGGDESSETTEDQYAGETTAPAPPPEPADPPAAEAQYDDEGASAPETTGADTDEAEAQEPEVQEEEIQEPEVQEEEIQDPEIQEPEAHEPKAQDPSARSNELAASTPPPVEDEAPAEAAEEVPVRASAELPSNDTSAPPSSAHAAPAGAAAITTLPETGGASVLAPAAGALLVCSGLVAARLARRPDRDTGDGR